MTKEEFEVLKREQKEQSLSSLISNQKSEHVCMSLADSGMYKTQKKFLYLHIHHR